MKYIYLVISLYCAEWLFYPDAEWEFLLLNKYLIIATLVTAIFVEFKTSLVNRSVLALLTLSVWADFITFTLKHYGAINTDLSIPLALTFFCWLLYTIKRSYPESINSVNANRVAILVMKPKSEIDVFKSLLGAPVPSICIVSDGYVWSFRRHSGTFEKSIYNDNWLSDHIVVDTGIKVTLEMVKELEKVVGKKSFPYCKCVWSVRKVLNMLGGKYRVVSWLDYIPGFYALRILRG